MRPIALARSLLTHSNTECRLLSVFLLPLLGLWLNAAEITPTHPPLPRAHSHNDYLQKTPLLDALKYGFCSVEADIFLVDGSLLIGHERSQLRPDRTLQSLYLDPLRARVQSNHGSVHPGYPRFHLLIDIKTDAEPTYARLKTVLKDYESILTRYDKNHTTLGAVSITISGNRPKAILLAEETRWVGYDGRLSDLNSNLSHHTMPMVSDSWTTAFKWKGIGAFPEVEKKRLRELVASAHSKSYKLRLWGAPDLPNAWREYLDAGLDVVNTDHLPELAQFLQAHPQGLTQ